MLNTSGKNIGKDLAAGVGVGHTDISVARTSLYMDLREVGWRNVTALAFAATLAPPETLTVTLMQATSSGGAAAKAVGSPVVVTARDNGASPPGDVAVSASVGADISDLDTDNGFYFVAVRVQSNAASAGGGVLLSNAPRFTGGTGDAYGATQKIVDENNAIVG
jgi:hypothetical protein